MTDHQSREQAIKHASAQVATGSVWLRRAVDAPKPNVNPQRPPAPPASASQNANK
jgi:hypothetical protein